MCGEMVDIGEPDKMIISEKWIYQTLSSGLIVIFCFLTEEFLKLNFFELFYFSYWGNRWTNGECKKV